MENDWKPYKLGDLVSIKHGWPFRSDLFSDNLTGRPIVVSIGNFEYTGGFRFDSTKIKEYLGEYPPDYELSPGDVLLVMTCQTAGGEILGIPGRIPDDGRVYLHNQRMGKVELLHSDQAFLDYLYWLFLWKPFNQALFNTASGTKILHTSPGRIEAFDLRLPSLPEQRAIAHILGSLDDKIELNRRMNATLEEMARAIFQSWFVDFDPVRAKAAGRAPSGLDAATAALFPDAFEVVDGREVPQGWEVTSLDQIATYLNGLALQKFPPEGDDFLPVVKIAQMRKGHTRDSDKASPDIPSQYVVDDGDILFSWSGSLEVVIWCGGRGALNQHLFKVSSEHYPKWFYYLWTRHHLPEFQFIAASKVTTMGHIQRHHLTQASVVVPSSEVLSVADEALSPLIDRIIENDLQSRTLTALRDTLLPKLISGELRVRDAERLVEDNL